jgi:hypothetical protein
VNSQKYQIQTLIAEIDALLQPASSRFQWFAAKPLDRHRPTLERLRQYLVQQQQTLGIEGRSRPGDRQADSAGAPHPTTEAQQMLQTLTQEMRGVRASVLQPLRAEVVTLMHQRDALQQEVQQLKQSSQSLEVAQPQLNQQMINEFLQVLMARLQENLAQQVGQVLENHVAHSPLYPAPGGIALPETWEAPLQRSTQQLDQLQQVHDRTDQVLGNLDTTLSVVFDSLQRNIQTYQDSLTQGVGQMHNLGQQGEAMLAGLVDRLTQQLQQAQQLPSPGATTAALAAMSAAVPPPAVPPEASATPPRPPTPLDLAPPVDGANLLPAASRLPIAAREHPGFSMPYPGMELRSPSRSEAGTAIATSSAELMNSIPLAAHDEINALTDLFQQLTDAAETTPVVVPIKPPDLAAAPRSLEIAVEAPGLPPAASELSAPEPTSTPTAAPAAAETYTIFSLEGMDDLFLDAPSNPTAQSSPRAQPPPNQKQP